ACRAPSCRLQRLQCHPAHMQAEALAAQEVHIGLFAADKSTGRPDSMHPYTFDGRTNPTKGSDSVIRCASGVTRSDANFSRDTGAPLIYGSPSADKAFSIASIAAPTALSHRTKRALP